VSMGLLDAVHAALPYGPSWAWTRYTATVAGGVLFAASPIPVSNRLWQRRREVLSSVVAASVATAIAVALFAERFPTAIVNNSYTTWPKVLNAVGGAGFAVAATFFLRTFSRSGSPDALVFAGHTLLFAVTSFLFWISAPWDKQWWLWHVLRLIAYFVVVRAAYVTVVEMDAALRRRHDDLEIEVRERTLALRGREALLRLISDNAATGLVRVSRDGRYLAANPAYAAITGVEREQMIGRRLVDVMGPAAWETIRPYVDRVLAGERVEYEAEVPFAHGGTRVIHVVYMPDTADAGTAGWVASVTDISDRKRAEDALRRAAGELAEANRLKDEFLATLSHELRTPLNVILGWATALQRRDGGLDASKAHAAIVRNATVLTQLVGDLLDVSRVITGKLRLDLQRVDLEALIEAAVDTVSTAASARNIRIRVRAEGVPAIEADPTRVQQALWNLLSNAVKFSPSSGLVDVVARRRDAHAEILVRDFGIGIAPAFLPHVFDRFRQADASATRAHGGLGLGLAIVRHVAELHGGSVHADSAGEGAGTTFTLVLPIRSAVSTDTSQHESGENEDPV